MLDATFNFDDDDALDGAVRKALSEQGITGESFVLGPYNVELSDGRKVDFPSFQKMIHECACTLVRQLQDFISALLPKGDSVGKNFRVKSCGQREFKFELEFNFQDFEDLNGSMALNYYRELFKEHEHVLFAVIASVARIMGLTFDSVRESIFCPNVVVSFFAFNDVYPSESVRKEIPDVTVADLFSLASFDDSKALNLYDDPLAGFMSGDAEV